MNIKNVTLDIFRVRDIVAIGPVPPWWYWTTISKQVIGRFLTFLGGNSCFTAKGGPVQANRPSTTMMPSATKRPSATMVVLGHHVKTSLARFLTYLG